MQYLTIIPTPQSPTKHASGYVLNVLKTYAVDGICTLSYDDISSISGYCPRAVKTAMRRLIDAKLVRVTKQPGDRRNSYEVSYAAQTTPA